MKKVIYMYWAQKFVNAPYLVKKCLLSWKLKNPTWQIIELDDGNLSEYINIEKEIPNIQKKNINKCHYSDIIRVLLLEKYGGCWCDATTFCNQSLDNWLNKNTLTGFFAFDKPGPDRLLSNWFLYSEPNNYIIQKWKEKIILYWKNHNKINHYFRHHYLFGDLYNSDKKFKELWDWTPKISANGPHFILCQGILKNLSDKVKNHINEVKTPVYKLTYKYNKKFYNENCNLSYILNFNEPNNLLKNDFKHIFIIWLQGFDNMPEICKVCYNSWKYKNPNWKINFIDYSNLNQYIDERTLYSFRKMQCMRSYCQAIRLYLIYKYGGLYVDATMYCNKSLDLWLNNNLIENTFVQWDFDSNLPSINILYSNKIRNSYFNIDIELNKLDNSFHKINNVFVKKIKSLKSNFINKQEKLIGKSSNNTNPKQGVKIIANSFRLMNEKNDNNFSNTLNIYPFFKLTHKGFPMGKLSEIFHNNSKLITLLHNNNENIN